MPKGHTFGYGAGYVAKDTTRVAVVPVGYTDGFSVEKKRDLFRPRDVMRYVKNDLEDGRARAISTSALPDIASACWDMWVCAMYPAM